MTTVEYRAKGAELDAAEAALTAGESKYGFSSVELVPLIEAVADLYSVSGLCGKAEILYRRLVDILEAAGRQAKLLEALGKLGSTYRAEGKLDEAEVVYRKALTIVGDEDESRRQLAEHLCLMAGIQVQRLQHKEAEKALSKACESFDEALGKSSNYARLCHMALATLFIHQGRTGEAQEQFLCAGQVSGASDETLSDERSLLELAMEYYKQARLVEVELLLMQTIYSAEHRLWPGHPLVGKAMHERGELFLAQGRFPEAEKAFRQALVVRQAVLGQAHSEIAHTAMSLASMYVAQGRYADAEPVLRQAMKTRVLVFGVEHPSVAAAIETYVTVLKNTKRAGLAAKLEARARDIRTKLVWHSERQAAANRPPAQ